MSLKAEFTKKTFHFRFDARTSRGALKEKTSWFFKICDSAVPDKIGWGEAGPLPGLSPETPEEVETQLTKLSDLISSGDHPKSPFTLDSINQWAKDNLALSSSVLFALETALLDLQGGGRMVLFENEFLKGKPIPINGLVWLGGIDHMLQQISVKINDGFDCLKIKVGSLDFEKEFDILQYIRRKYFRAQITIRLDANGGFKNEEVIYKLNELSKWKIHSIEQPVKPGQLDFMEDLCKKSPIPVALDEELIGVPKESRESLLKKIKPAFIILKPTIHGGLKACSDLIGIAQTLDIGWWMTSALESNIGLNSIAQFTGQYPVSTPQGLGTGQIYDNNIEGPLEVEKGSLKHNPRLPWDMTPIS